MEIFMQYDTCIPSKGYEMTSLLPLGSLDAYIQQVNQIPFLTLEQEQDLANRWYQHHDLEAARLMVLAHLRYVVKIARGYAGYGLAIADLIQEGNIGLMKAVKRFNPAIGVRLVSFAVHWIKAEIHEFILRNWRIVKIATTKAQRKLFFNLRKAKKRLGWFSQEEIDSVARDLGVSVAEVKEMEKRVNAHDTALEAHLSEEEDSGSYALAPIQYLEAPHSDPAEIFENNNSSQKDEKNLYSALSVLDTRSQEILHRRWLTNKKATLHELAEEYKVSAERIRQLEQNAMKKLKLALSN